MVGFGGHQNQSDELGEDWGGTSADIREMSIVGGAYDHLKRSNKFECCAWVNLMHPLNPTKSANLFSNSIKLREAGKATCANSSMLKEDHLNDEFNEYLSDKCYLVMLNDLSTAEEWKQIKMLFPDNKKGSRIIVFKNVKLAGRTEEVAPEQMQRFDQFFMLFAVRTPSVQNDHHIVFLKGF